MMPVMSLASGFQGTTVAVAPSLGPAGSQRGGRGRLGPGSDLDLPGRRQARASPSTLLGLGCDERLRRIQGSDIAQASRRRSGGSTPTS